MLILHLIRLKMKIFKSIGVTTIVERIVKNRLRCWTYRKKTHKFYGKKSILDGEESNS